MAKRATIKNYDAFYTNGFDFDDGYLIDASGKIARYVDAATQNELAIQGSNLKFEHGLIVRGTITGLRLINDDGDIVQRISGLKIDAGEIAGDTPKEFAQAAIIRFLFSDMKMIGGSGSDNWIGQWGNDILLGKGDDDDLDGGRGNDTLTGGSGFDTFMFGAHSGKDVITDFDAEGGVGAQDFIDATFPGADAIEKSGKNDTLIRFGDGNSVKLLGIDPDQIDASDFV